MTPSDQHNWLREELKHIRFLSFSLTTICLAVIYLAWSSPKSFSELRELEQELSRINEFVQVDKKPTYKLAQSLTRYVYQSVVMESAEKQLIEKVVEAYPIDARFFDITFNYHNFTELLVTELDLMPAVISTDSIGAFSQDIQSNWQFEFSNLKLLTDAGMIWKWYQESKQKWIDGKPAEPIEFHRLIIQESEVIETTNETLQLVLKIYDARILPERAPILKLYFSYKPQNISLPIIKGWYESEFVYVSKYLDKIKDKNVKQAKDWVISELENQKDKVSIDILSFKISGTGVGTFIPAIIFVIQLYLLSYALRLKRFVNQSKIEYTLSPTLLTERNYISGTINILSLVFLPVFCEVIIFSTYFIANVALFPMVFYGLLNGFLGLYIFLVMRSMFESRP